MDSRIIPEHGLKPDWAWLFNENGGNHVWEIIRKKRYDYYSNSTAPYWGNGGLNFMQDNAAVETEPLNTIFPASQDGSLFFRGKIFNDLTYNYAYTGSPSSFKTFNLQINRSSSYVAIGTYTGFSLSKDQSEYTSFAVSWKHETDGSLTIKVYGDGVLEADLSLSSQVFPTATTNFSIGCRPTASSRHFGGVMSCFYCYNRTLSGLEILSLHQNSWQFLYSLSEQLIRSVWAVSGGTILTGTISESAAIIDSTAAQATFGSSISESAAITDSDTGQAQFASSILESAGITDLISALAEMQSLINESNTIIDNAESQAQFISSINESAAITDLLTAGATIIYGTINESAGVSDSLSSFASYLSNISETLATSDNLSSFANMLSSIAESNSIQDIATAIAEYHSLISESVSITDLLSAVAGVIEYARITSEINALNRITSNARNTNRITAEIRK